MKVKNHEHIITGCFIYRVRHVLQHRYLLTSEQSCKNKQMLEAFIYYVK